LGFRDEGCGVTLLCPSAGYFEVGENGTLHAAILAPGSLLHERLVPGCKKASLILWTTQKKPTDGWKRAPSADANHKSRKMARGSA
jgi:hypothetical protein